MSWRRVELCEQTNKEDRMERLNNCLGTAAAVRPLTKITDQVDQCATVAVFGPFFSQSAFGDRIYWCRHYSFSLSLFILSRCSIASFIEHISPLKLASILQNQCGHKTEPLNFSVEYLQHPNHGVAVKKMKRDCNVKKQRKKIEVNKYRNILRQ